jgi:two-component system nitrogen regulation sensor histidine kinase NtrY
MKLRGRFTLALALAALVPISLAAIITTRVIANRSREDYNAQRQRARNLLNLQIKQLRDSVERSVTTLAGEGDPLVGKLLHDLANGNVDVHALRDKRLDAQEKMKSLGLDTLTITGPFGAQTDAVLVSAHDWAAVLDAPQPGVARRARDTHGEAFFACETVRSSSAKSTILVAEAARLANAQDVTAAVSAGRRIPDDLFALVRSPEPYRVEVRLKSACDPIPPKSESEWAALVAKNPPITIDLPGPDGKPIATVEAAVSDNGLDELLLKLTLTAAVLAIIGLGAVVAVGLLVARRTARDLEALVEGSLHAARGDLEYRVPVRSRDEVGAVASAFNFMMEDLRTSKERLVIAERIAAWQDIARRLAHEIKNPLTPIQMAMDTLRKSYKKQHPEFGEILDESTATVLEEADRLKRIVAEFSDFARMPKPEWERVDLNEIVKGSLALYQGAVPVDMQLAKDLPELDADKGQLNQVLLNLVENSRDAIGARDGGRITVSTKNAQDRALLVVEDNGPGVPPDLKDKVFAPYFTTKQGKGGTGLGLAIVHRIISDHGGRITISDAARGGARFTIELPLRNGTALLASRI